MIRKHFPELNKQYGNFTIVSEEIRRNRSQQILFKVKCTCNKEQFVRAYFLESGRQTCCKQCRSKINYNIAKQQDKKIGFIKLYHEGVGNFTKTTYWYFKNNAKKRGIEWNDKLTIEYLYNLLLEQNKKCKLTGLDIDLTESRINSNINFELMTASLDRIDSLKGYEPNNVQWVHKHINKMKNNFNEDYFINMCELIVNHANQQGS
jgi:hypothetical protein